jgi:hypothetical protein
VLTRRAACRRKTPRAPGRLGLALGLVGCLSIGGPLAAQQAEAGWVVPRTADGRPDLQGNWSNATMTPIERPAGQSAVLTPAQVAQLEGRREDLIQARLQPSDPDRSAPPVGGDGSTGAAGGVGGYNYFFIDAGDQVAIVEGEYRSSLLTDPPNGQRPELTAEGRRVLAARAAASRAFGAFDNPENRPLAERCIMSFGSNAGPPMLPNYFYNNNYTIVQTPSHVMIMTEMVHDVRIIPMGEPDPLPSHVRPWMGDSRGHWEGDTLVIVTTNLHPDQTLLNIPPSDQMRVTERITRVSEHTLHYAFTVEDPVVFERPFGGELPFHRLDGLVYEYACHEGNYAMENVLRGARAEEARQSPGGKGPAGESPAGAGR